MTHDINSSAPLPRTPYAEGVAPLVMGVLKDSAAHRYHFVKMGGIRPGKEPGKIPGVKGWNTEKTRLDTIVWEVQNNWPIAIVPSKGDSGWRMMAIDFDFAEGRQWTQPLEDIVWANLSAEGAFLLPSGSGRGRHLYVRVSDEFSMPSDGFATDLHGLKEIERKGDMCCTLWSMTPQGVKVMTDPDAPPQDYALKMMLLDMGMPQEQVDAERRKAPAADGPQGPMPAHLMEGTKTTPPLPPVLGQAPKPPSAKTRNGVKYNPPKKGLGDFSKVEKGCDALQQLRKMNGGPREACRMLCGMAKFCKGGREEMHGICKGHADYDETENNALFDTWVTGPPTCDNMDAVMKAQTGRGCKATCEHYLHKGKPTTPPWKTPVVLGDAPMVATTHDGREVENELWETRSVDSVLQACDFIGMEVYYDKFTQSEMVFRRDLADPMWAKAETQMLDLARLDANAQMTKLVRKTDKETGEVRIEKEPATWPKQDFKEIIGVIKDPRFADTRHVNAVREILEQVAPKHLCTEADYEKMLNYHLECWDMPDKESLPPEEIALIRRLTEQMGVNFFDRGYNPGAMLRTQMSYFGRGEGGKTDAIRHILPEQAQSLKLFKGSLNLTRDPALLVKEQSQFWLAELAEISGVRNSKDIDRIKDFLTGQQQGARPLYHDYERMYDMTCCGIGTANLKSDSQPYPDDDEFKMRLVHIMVSGAPSGSADDRSNPFGGKMERWYRETGWRDTLWRGWGYAYHHLGLRGRRGVGQARDYVLRRTASLTYRKDGVEWVIDKVMELAKVQGGVVDLKNGVSAGDMVEAVRMEHPFADIPTGMSTELGKRLRASGFTHHKQAGHKAAKWTHPLFESEADATPPMPAHIKKAMEGEDK